MLRLPKSPIKNGGGLKIVLYQGWQPVSEVGSGETVAGRLVVDWA